MLTNVHHTPPPIQHIHHTTHTHIPTPTPTQTPTHVLHIYKTWGIHTRWCSTTCIKHLRPSSAFITSPLTSTTCTSPPPPPPPPPPPLHTPCSGILRAVQSEEGRKKHTWWTKDMSNAVDVTIGMSHVTHMVPAGPYEWVVSRKWSCHACDNMNESCHTRKEWVVSHVWSCHTCDNMNESCHTCARNESCHTYGHVIHVTTWKSHATHTTNEFCHTCDNMNQSCHTHDKWVVSYTRLHAWVMSHTRYLRVWGGYD